MRTTHREQRASVKYDGIPRSHRVRACALFGPYESYTKTHRGFQERSMDMPLVNTDFAIWPERWNRMHLEELVVHPELRGSGIGQWFFYKWLLRIKPLSGAIHTSAVHRKEFANDLGLEAPPEVYFRNGTLMDPVITLCVDAWNIGARKLYAKLGFQQYVRRGSDGEILECPSRVSMVGPMLKLESTLEALTNKGGRFAPPLVTSFFGFLRGALKIQRQEVISPKNRNISVIILTALARPKRLL